MLFDSPVVVVVRACVCVCVFHCSTLLYGMYLISHSTHKFYTVIIIMSYTAMHVESRLMLWILCHFVAMETRGD